MMLVLVLGTAMSLSSCSKDDDDEGSGKVTVSYTRGTKNASGGYPYTFTVKYWGNASDVAYIGMKSGSTAQCNYEERGAYERAECSVKKTLGTGVFYYKGYVKLKSNTVIYSDVSKIN